jgi:hypothetical protein
MVPSFTRIIKRTIHISTPYTESSPGCNPLWNVILTMIQYMESKCIGSCYNITKSGCCMPWILFKVYAHTLCIVLVFIMPRKIKKKHECRINFKKVYSETLGYLLTPKCKEGTWETTCNPARLALFHNFFKI